MSLCARVFFCRAFLFIFVAFGVCVSARARARVPHCTRGGPRTSSPTGVMVRASACDRVNRGGAGSERQRARARWGLIRGRDARARARATTRRLFLAFSAQLFRDSSWCTCRELEGDALRAARARPARARPHPRSPVAAKGDFPCPPARRCPTSPTPPRVHSDPAAAPTDCRRFKCTRDSIAAGRRPALRALSSTHHLLRPPRPPPRIPQALPGQVTPAGVPEFKLVIVGDGGTGASARACAPLLRALHRPRRALAAAAAAQQQRGQCKLTRAVPPSRPSYPTAA